MTINSETKVLIGILVGTIGLIIAGAFLVSRGNTAATEPVDQPERLVRASDAAAGPTDAKVTVVEFGDFQCPSCGAVYPILKQLKADNQNASVRFVYRHFPLPQHEHAALAAEAAVAAQQQGKFWEYHDKLFENQSQLDRASLERYAVETGLDMAAFTAALNDHTYQNSVNEDVSDGRALRVQATPTIFINSVPYNGSYSVATLQAAINEALNK